ncbi:MAG: hypothetical protein FJ303_05430 [Planctomycetes bacterium]|nr:hypothetical protein [Planctomycetota bacterium]
MSDIVGLDNISDAEFNREIQNGARFVVFSYCISLIIVSFKRASAIYFIRAGESRFAKGLPYTLLTLVAGPWGIPFGIIYTIWCIFSNSTGGTDVTEEILAGMAQHRS